MVNSASEFLRLLLSPPQPGTKGAVYPQVHAGLAIEGKPKFIQDGDARTKDRFPEYDEGWRKGRYLFLDYHKDIIIDFKCDGTYCLLRLSVNLL